MSADSCPHRRRRRRLLVVHGPRTAAAALALTAAACASSPASPGAGPRPATRSAGARPSMPAFLEAPTKQPTGSQSGSGLAARLLDAQSAPSGYQVLPASAFTVATGPAAGAPACSSEAFGNPYGALTTVRPVEVAERGIDGPDDSGGFFWRSTELLLGYQGTGAQDALTALRRWVARCSQPQPQPGGAPAAVSIGTGPKLGDESLTLHVSMSVRISSGAAVAPFDSVVVRTGTVVFVLCEQGVPAGNDSGDNAARLTAVANAAYARFQHS